MRKFHIKRNPGSSLIEPANRPTRTSSTARKSTVLETIGEIISILAIFIIGWLILVIF